MKRERLNLNGIFRRDLDFLRILRKLQDKHNAYWIKATRVRDEMFGKIDISIKNKESICKRERLYNRNTARARACYERLIEASVVDKTKHKPKGSRECVYLHAHNSVRKI